MSTAGLGTTTSSASPSGAVLRPGLRLRHHPGDRFPRRPPHVAGDDAGCGAARGAVDGVGYSWLTNAVPAEDVIPTRLVIFAGMAAMFVVLLAVPGAFLAARTGRVASIGPASAGRRGSHQTGGRGHLHRGETQVGAGLRILRAWLPRGVDALAGPPEGHDLAGVWAWEDEEAGRVRATVFPVRFGIEEDEATGTHAVRLAARLGRRLTIRQGKGSLILAEPRPYGTVEIGGRTDLVEMRDYEGGS